MESSDDDPPPPVHPTSDGNSTNSDSNRRGEIFPIPGTSTGEETPAPGNPPGPLQPLREQHQQGVGSSVYDLFLTAVGLTPRGLRSDAPLPGEPDAEVEEEEVWSAIEEGGEDGAGAGASGGVDSGNTAGLSHLPSLGQPQTASLAGTTGVPTRGDEEGSSDDREIRNGSSFGVAGDTGSATATSSATESAPRPGAVLAVSDGDSQRGTVGGHQVDFASHAQQPQPSETNSTSGFPSGGSSPGLEATRVSPVASTTRRRTRGFNSNSATESETGSRPLSSRSFSTTTPGAFRRRTGNLFRSGNLRSFLHRSINDSARSDNVSGEEYGDGMEGTRAVERAINGADQTSTARGARATTVVAGAGVNDMNNGSNSLTLTNERGNGRGGGDGGTGDERRILFYHKPTLANVPAGDVPDVVPVYLGCPRGNMALGLPLNESWQGEDQDTTFNQNLSYTILSWPEDHVEDMLELWRLQVFFFTAIVFNILLSALLLFTDNPDRTRVEGFARPGAFPGPFQHRSPADEPTGLRSEEWHVAAALILSVLGVVCVMVRIRAGITLYLVLTVINAVVGLSNAPDALFACRFGVDLVLVAMGRCYLSSLSYTWVTASAGDGRRG